MRICKAVTIKIDKFDRKSDKKRTITIVSWRTEEITAPDGMPSGAVISSVLHDTIVIVLFLSDFLSNLSIFIVTALHILIW